MEWTGRTDWSVRLLSLLACLRRCRPFPEVLAVLRSTLAFVLLLAGALAVGCNQAAPPPPPPKAPEVIVARAVSEPVTDFEEFTGRTEAIETVEVKSHYTGYLEKVLFEEGADVKKGQVLFEIDPRLADAAVKKAEADVANAKAHAERLETDFQRISKLPKESVSTSEYDKTVGDLSEARAAVKSADAALKSAEVTLSYTKVYSPINGRISRRMVDPGNTVKADETSLTWIVNDDPMYVYFDVDERTFRELQKRSYILVDGKKKPVKLPVYLGLADEESWPHKGYVDFVDNRVDPNTGSVWLRGVFPNADRSLTPGFFARVNLPIGDPHPALLIPEQALGTDQGQKFVYVLNDANEAKYRKIKVGAQHGQRREVLKGVESGERVIVSGLQRVRPDAKVEPKEETKSADKETRRQGDKEKS
jgi:RND family efflux transporter MFP subunit